MDNYGTLVCEIVCILIHCMIELNLYSIFEVFSSFIIFYGMLVIKDVTNNACGCIFIFLLFWNTI